MVDPAGRRRAKRTVTIGILTLVLVSILILASYRWYIQSVVSRIPVVQVLDETSFPMGQYYDVAWIDKSTIAFIYVPQALHDLNHSPDYWDRQLILYNLDSLRLELVSVPADPKCYSAWIVLIERLPNGNLGFLHECNSMSSVKNGTTLYELNPALGELIPLQYYPAPFQAGRFSFSPDMTELIQHNAIGAGLNDELYRLGADGASEQLFAGWQRVAVPRWSPDGRFIAFFGTQDSRTGEPGTFSEIEALARLPWNLYLMDAKTDNLELLLPDMGPGFTKWLPHGDWLAFGGEFRHRSGLWLININTKDVLQLWPEWAAVDFSPDGTYAVILRSTEVDGDLIRMPIVVSLPPEYSSTSAP